MASSARDAFLTGLDALKGAVDLEPVRNADNTGDFIRRGLTVASFNLLESFIASRLEEVATFLNAGHAQFLDLPERLQRQSILNTVRVANGRLRRYRGDLNGLRSFARHLGASLTAVDRNLHLSEMTWLWEGSNLAMEDYANILRLFHVPEPWLTAKTIAERVGFGSLDLKAALEDLVRERHLCAHEALHGVTSIWLRTVPERLLVLASALDVLVSVAAVQMRTGQSAFLSDEKWLAEVKVQLRFVRERAAGAGEYLEGRTRANHVAVDVDALMAAAAGRCGDSEAIIRTSIAGTLVDWAVPALG